MQVAVDSFGNFFTLEPYFNRVQKFTSTGEFVTRWGSYGWQDGQLNDPSGVAVDASGNVYVVDKVNSRIQKFTSTGEFMTKWGSPGSSDGQFTQPRGMAVDASGNVYVSEGYPNYRIQEFTSEGAFVRQWGSQGTGDGQFDALYGVVADQLGNVYVADCGNNRIQKFTSGGVFVRKWGGYGSADGQFEYPDAVSVDASGNVYVADNWFIQKFTSEGVFVCKWGGQGVGNGQFSGGPSGLAVDASENVYVGDPTNERIQKFKSDGVFVSSWGSSGWDDGHFSKPFAVAVNASGNVYVAEANSPYSDRIQKFTSNGLFVTKWGSWGSGNGLFTNPTGVAMDVSGNVYVADGNRIQKFDSGGAFLRKWGSPGTGDGQFDGAKGIAVDGSGNVYVTDSCNNRIQKFTSEGVFVAKWGSQGTGDGELRWPSGVAVDGSGNVYVGDEVNHRIQKFTSTGGFLTKWGSYGTNPGQFFGPVGVAVDTLGNVFVVEKDGCRIQKFNSDGTLLLKWGSLGNGNGQFNQPYGVSVDSSGNVYVADMGNNRIQKFKAVTLTSNAKAVIVAGGGPFDGNGLWDATQASANFAYNVLTYQGFTKETIYYLSSNTTLDLDGNLVADDVDGNATGANLQTALETWVPTRLGDLPTGDVVVYLVDHGGDGTFRMSGTETLSASDLAGWLANMQSSPNVTGRVTVVYDACESGTFQLALAAPNRTVITSTSPGEAAYFLQQGTVSFSSFFWSQVFNGEDLDAAFSFATDAVGQTLGVQNPLVNVDGDGTPNEATGDLDALVGMHIGSGTDLFQGRPTLGSVSGPQTISGSTATLSATNVTDPQGDRIVRVWAVIRPPDYAPSDPNNPVQNLPSLDLNRVGDTDNFSGDYTQFTSAGTYYIAIYAMDANLNVSTPSATQVSVNSPRKKRAVIVAGGSVYDSQWPSYERCYKEAYDALRKQGYADTELYVMAYTTVVAATVHLPSLSNLEYALGAWAGSDTQDLALYMVGPGGSDLFQISTSQTLDGVTLDGWLDTLETQITGRVTVVYDACNAGSFLPLLAKTGRIVVASARPNESARFLKDGDVSFSKFFWGRALNGATVERCFLDAKAAMQFGGGGQLAQLDDNGNGVPNEASDGQVARFHLLGTGITTAGDAPLIGSAIGDQTLSGTTAVTLWAHQVTTTGTIQAVWAAITPPGYTTGDCAPLVPLVELATGGTHQYEGAYNGFTKAGEYSVALYAMDTTGSISAAKECVITQTVATDTTPPSVTGFTPANASTGVARRPVIAFHVTDAGSGADMNAISVSVNGEDVSSQLTIVGLPSDYTVRYTPLVAFNYAATVYVAVNAADMDGNETGVHIYTFTTTNGTDANADGMPDDWAAHYVLSNPSGDADGDGFTNAEEAAMGTDPLAANAASSAPDAYEDDDSSSEATWFRRNDIKQRHTFHDLGDADWFEFYANQDDIITIETSNLGSDADTLMRLYQSDGTTLIAQDDNGGGGGASLVNWTVTSAGYYYVRVTNLPATAFGADACYDFQVRRDSGTINVTANAGHTPIWKQAGQIVVLDGLLSSDGDFLPATFAWDIVRYASATEPDMTLSYTGPKPTGMSFTPSVVGAYVVSLVVGDIQGHTDETRVLIAVGESKETVRVDFAANGVGADGSTTHPFKTLEPAMYAVDPGKYILVKPGEYLLIKPAETTENPTLGELLGSWVRGKAFFVYADTPPGGPAVRIGVVPPPLGKSLLTSGEERAPEATTTGAGPGYDDIGATVALGDTRSSRTQDAQDTAVHYDQFTYEPVLPFTRTADGFQAAQADSALAIRLRSDADIDPSSIWGNVDEASRFVPGTRRDASSTFGEDAASIGWQPVEEGNLRDVWVILQPQERWYFEDIIPLMAGATTVTGEPVESMTYQFRIESEAERDGRLSEPVPAIPQPAYGQDFDASELDESIESNSEAEVTPADEDAVTMPLPEGVDEPVTLGPEQVYDTPQRVWLPVPEGVNPGEVRLYYYHATGDTPGWYPAENVEGWLVPDSYLHLRLDGMTYLGFLVRHAGIVQLGVGETRTDTD